MSRGRIARWMLEEIGQPYRAELLEYRRSAGVMFGMIEKRPAFESYWERIGNRPAALRGIDDAPARSRSVRSRRGAGKSEQGGKRRIDYEEVQCLSKAENGPEQ